MSADKRTPLERAMGDTPIQVVSLGENLPSYTSLHHQLQLALAERDKARVTAAELRVALKSACRYLDKADADGLMQDCAMRPQTAAARYRALLAKLEAESKQ